MKALNENHHSNSGVKLATKHSLLTVAISAHSESSIIDVARALVSIIETFLLFFHGGN
jgi:hypothetical protein